MMLSENARRCVDRITIPSTSMLEQAALCVMRWARVPIRLISGRRTCWQRLVVLLAGLRSDPSRILAATMPLALPRLRRRSLLLSLVPRQVLVMVPIVGLALLHLLP